MGPERIPFDILTVLGGAAWLMVVAGAVLLIIWAVRAFPRRQLMGIAPAGLQPLPYETPLETLARRFALGEITAEEFERGRDLLSGGSPKP